MPQLGSNASPMQSARTSGVTVPRPSRGNPSLGSRTPSVPASPNSPTGGTTIIGNRRRPSLGFQAPQQVGDRGSVGRTAPTAGQAQASSALAALRRARSEAPSARGTGGGISQHTQALSRAPRSSSAIQGSPTQGGGQSVGISGGALANMRRPSRGTPNLGSRTPSVPQGSTRDTSHSPIIGRRRTPGLQPSASESLGGRWTGRPQTTVRPPGSPRGSQVPSEMLARR